MGYVSAIPLLEERFRENRSIFRFSLDPQPPPNGSARELKYCELCGRLFVRKASIERDPQFPSLLRKKGAIACPPCGSGNREHVFVSPPEPEPQKRQREIRDLVKEEKQRYRASGAAHPREGSHQRRSRAPIAALATRVAAAFAGGKHLTAADLCPLFGWKTNGTRLVVYCQNVLDLPLVVVGSVAEPGRPGRPRNLYALQ